MSCHQQTDFIFLFDEALIYESHRNWKKERKSIYNATKTKNHKILVLEKYLFNYKNSEYNILKDRYCWKYF